MPLPAFNEFGDLPAGLHCLLLAEVIEEFGKSTLQRQLVSQRLARIYQLAAATGKLLRFVIFGSYVTSKPNPNDVDIILVMADDLDETDYDPEMLPLFDHLRAQRELGASLFAVRPGFIVGESVETFLLHWQTTREERHRGIVEITQEVKQ